MRGAVQHSIVLAIAWVVLATAQESSRPESSRSNVLLITIHTLRADRLTPSLMPGLSALAARGVRFDSAYAHSPLTLPSHASILTGRLPPGHGVRNNGFRLNDQLITDRKSVV